MIANRWFKSSRSTGNGECVEVGWLTSSRSMDNGNCVEVCLNNVILVRDTKDRTGPVLSFGVEAWREFIEDVKSEL